MNFKKLTFESLMFQVKIVECFHGLDSAIYQALVSFTKFEYISQIITNIFILRLPGSTTVASKILISRFN